MVVHHTAGTPAYTYPDAVDTMRAMQRDHQQQNGWADIGYNYVIDRRGRVWEGRGFGIVGAHTFRQNTGTIGVSFMGNYENLRPTLRQLAAYRALRTRLRLQGARIRRTTGHKFMPGQSTACPGRFLVKALRLK